MTNHLTELAERLERSAIADAEHAVNNMFYAERAARKFYIANELKARSQAGGQQ